MCEIQNNKTKLKLPFSESQLLQINITNNWVGKTAKANACNSNAAKPGPHLLVQIQQRKHQKNV